MNVRARSRLQLPDSVLVFVVPAVDGLLDDHRTVHRTVPADTARHLGGGGLFGGVLPILDTELSAARSLIFWPFFVIGKLYGKQILNWAGSLRIWQKLFFTAAALGTVGYFYRDEVDYDWFYGSLNFAHFGVSIPEGVGLRLIIDIGSVLMTLMLLMWVGDRDNLIAKIGRHSLAVYIIHGFVVRGLQPLLDDSRDTLSSPVVLAICLLLALLTTYLLSLAPFERALRWYGSTVTALLLMPFAQLRSKPGKHSAKVASSPLPSST